MNDIKIVENIRIRGRFIARKASNGLTMIFGCAKDLDLGINPNDTGHDIVFAADLTGWTKSRLCPETECKSPEDILENGIPPLTVK